jgi:hypothetical protein
VLHQRYHCCNMLGGGASPGTSLLL